MLNQIVLVWLLVAGTYEWVFENRGADWVGQDYDGGAFDDSAFWAACDGFPTNASTTTASANITAPSQAGMCQFNASLKVDNAVLSMSVSMDHLFVRKRLISEPNSGVLTTTPPATSVIPVC